MSQPLVTCSATHKIRLNSTTQSIRALSPGKPDSDKKPSLEHQSLPIAKFSELGASRTVKLFVIAVLVVFGTMETIFWINVLWAKYGSASKEKGDMDKTTESKTSRN
jgi:hypothetical protein